MVAERALHDAGDLVQLERERRVLERRNHGALAERAEVAGGVAVGSARLVRVLLHHVVELRALLDLGGGLIGACLGFFFGARDRRRVTLAILVHHEEVLRADLCGRVGLRGRGLLGGGLRRAGLGAIGRLHETAESAEEASETEHEEETEDRVRQPPGGIVFGALGVGGVTLALMAAVVVFVVFLVVVVVLFLVVVAVVFLVVAVVFFVVGVVFLVTVFVVVAVFLVVELVLVLLVFFLFLFFVPALRLLGLFVFVRHYGGGLTPILRVAATSGANPGSRARSRAVQKNSSGASAGTRSILVHNVSSHEAGGDMGIDPNQAGASAGTDMAEAMSRTRSAGSVVSPPRDGHLFSRRSAPSTG